MQAELLYSAHAVVGECPVWIAGEQRLYWLDIEGLKLHRLNPVGSNDSVVDTTFLLPNLVGCFVPYRNGNFLIAAQTGIMEIRLTENGMETGIETVKILTHPEAGKPANRYNDGKWSPEGRFWFGSLNMQHQSNQASLYVLDDRGCRAVLTGATNSNGLGWSPDGQTFYWIDTPTRQIAAFDYDSANGELSRRRTVIAFPDDPDWGRPDGMTVDAEGMVWVAHWLGSRVTRWNPATGSLLEMVNLPVKRVTSCTFGGEKLDILFITTASRGLTPEEAALEPEAGGIFACKTQTVGQSLSKQSTTD
ncbi:regucalcin-like protein [Planctomycetales bacterium]|nr:regucalcin-like protein [Planctomycetales bacterium]